MILFDFRTNCEKCAYGIFTPAHCKNRRCSYLLAGNYNTTAFVINHIQNKKLMVKVIFVGQALYPISQWLLNLYATNTKYSNKLFVIITQTPSLIVRSTPDPIYESIIMPSCQVISATNKATDCRYEMNRIHKFYTQEMRSELVHALEHFKLNPGMLSKLYQLYDDYISLPSSDPLIVHSNSSLELEDHIMAIRRNKANYNEIACRWLKDDMVMEMKREMFSTKLQVTNVWIGVLLPYNGSYHGSSLEYVNQAISTYNKLDELKNYQIFTLKNNDKCEPDQAMTYFIKYYQKRDNFIGIVGPACNEAIEPIASRCRFS